jgi:FAD/FMN-containing dehydrogenase/Fe-S oxidoreductase
MIPALPPRAPLSPQVDRYLAALRARELQGDISVDWARRVVGATDNSVYQLTPEAIIYPRTREDVQLALSLLAEEAHREVHLTPRGGGTGTNGQSLNTGVILDLSRYFGQILEVNTEEGWARVQAGVVLDQLNDALAPSGCFFAPNLSPSSRATIGGMINTDAAGQGSMVYGKTSDHILSLEVALLGGACVTVAPLTVEELASGGLEPAIEPLAREVLTLAAERAPLVERVFPKLSRFLTGYNLKMTYDAEGRTLDLTRLFSGSEGTLGVVVEATVRLTPLPAAKRVVLLRYARFEDALGSARLLLEARPNSIETIDDNILRLARQDVIYHRVRAALEGGEGAGVRAINLLEFEGPSEAEVEARAAACVEGLRGRFGEPDAPVGAYIARSAAEQAALWDLRKKGVGLLAAREGERKPVAFVEDTVVPPERLKEYVAEFTALLDAEGLEYGMFGHVDVGCLHVRPALNLLDPADEARLLRVSNKVAALARSYGGVIWGEHGKGIRSAYSPEVFGPLYPTLQEIKALFDPHNQLNPGKVATPAGSRASLMELASPLRAHADRGVQPEALAAFVSTVHCNGNAQCLDYHPDHIMCPSSKVRRDRLHSPKGRAGVMRAWLRALADEGYALSRAELEPFGEEARAGRGRGGLMRSLRGLRALKPAPRAPDLSHEVYDAMSGCLSCKACATHCPVKVDVPRLKSRFLHLYHARYPRPLRDYLVGALEGGAAVGARAPRLANLLSQNPLARALSRRLFGLIDAPALSPRSALARLRDLGARAATPAALAALPASDRARAVVLIPDAFTAFFDADVLVDAYVALDALGALPFVGPFKPNGKGYYVKGRLEEFARCAEAQAELLRPLAAAGVSLVVVDPAVALTYRDEYREALGDALGFEVLLPQEWLAARLELLPEGRLAHAPPATLLGHCTERALAPQAMGQWGRVFARLGAPLEVASVGCCGMCGVFGHEAEHAEESAGVFDMSWRPALDALDAARDLNGALSGEPAPRPLATGYSCRAQSDRLRGEAPPHPLSWLARALAGASGQAQGPLSALSAR